FTATLFARESKNKLIRNDSCDQLSAYDDNIIERDVTLTEDGITFNKNYLCDVTSEFKLHNPMHLVKSGVEVILHLLSFWQAIIEDEVTKRFTAGELRVWNFLSRNQIYYTLNKHYNFHLNALWCIGFFIRYVILFPSRFAVFICSILSIWFLGTFATFLTDSSFKRGILTSGLQCAIRLNLRAFSTVVRYHNILM
ncbi:unnamed protein product, partial [Protopolystoma xenopodis]